MCVKKAELEVFRSRVKIMIPHMAKSEMVKHFLKQNVPRSTIYSTIDRMANDGGVSDADIVGTCKEGQAQQKLARKFQVHQTTISRQLVKMAIKHRKREKTPKYSAIQQKKSKRLSFILANNLYRNSKSIIMDDEKYFTLNGHNMPGNSGYYTDSKDTVPDSVRFTGKEKFPLKVLVWVAISERGISKPLIRPSKSAAINSAIYIKECLEKRLLPFINEYHPDHNYVF